MKDRYTEKKPLRGLFPRISKEEGASDKAEQKTDPAPNQYYAIASHHEVLTRFKLIKANAYSYSIPYALLPICIQHDSGQLFLKSYELLISISGRNLEPIEAHFSAGTLKWVKASKSGKDDGTSDIFVKDIKIEGEAVAIEGEI